MSQSQDIHYLRHVTELGETHGIVAFEDIKSAFGAKLVNKGSFIDSQVFERLVQHKLVKPLDMSITIKNAVTPQALMKRAHCLAQGNSPLQTMLRALSRPGLPFEYLGQLHLNPVIANKLTVMRERIPRLFDHSLEVALLSVALGLECRLSSYDLSHLAAAGAFHDIGELHIDPRIQNPDHRLDEADQRQIYAHPVIGFLILKQFGEYHPHVSNPVLEHHERMDGSGYPKDLKASELTKTGRIVALSELAVGVTQKASYGYLETVIKSQPMKFDSDAIKALSRLLRQINDDDDSRADLADFHQLQMRFGIISEILAFRDTAADELKQAPKAIADLWATRLFALRFSLYSAGINPDNPGESLALFEGDAAALNEAESLLRETLYQIANLINETRRRWRDLEVTFEFPLILKEWSAKTETLLAKVKD